MLQCKILKYKVEHKVSCMKWHFMPMIYRKYVNVARNSLQCVWFNARKLLICDSEIVFDVAYQGERGYQISESKIKPKVLTQIFTL